MLHYGIIGKEEETLLFLKEEKMRRRVRRK